MVFLGFALGTWISVKRGKSAGIESNVIMDLVIWILVSSLIGARLMYVLFHLDEFKGRWLDAISPIQIVGTVGIAGLVILGGVLAAVPAGAWFLRKKNIPFLKMADIMAPGLAIGIAAGRIGCFLNGCCFGHPTELPWGIAFPEECLAGSMYPHQTIHPTQLYAIIYNLGVGIFLMARSPHKKITGELFYLFLILYGVFRFLNESVRYYRPSMVPLHFGSFDLTISMIISILMALTGVILLAKGFRKTGKHNESR